MRRTCDRHDAIRSRQVATVATTGEHPVFRPLISLITHTRFFRKRVRGGRQRKKRHDFLLCMFGAGHKPVADAHADMIVCEPGSAMLGDILRRSRSSIPMRSYMLISV